MGIEFKREIELDKFRQDMITKFINNTPIKYDHIIYYIMIKDKNIGVVIQYKVPAGKSCYIDILMFPEFKNRRYGKSSLNLFINKYLKDYEQIYIKSKDNQKTIFLIENDFKFIEENLYKDLFVREIS